MTPRSLAALLVATPLIAAACGSVHVATEPATMKPVKRTPAPPSQLVLHLRDVGYGYIPVASQSGPISLAAELKSDTSALSRRIDHASYVSGSKSLFANATDVGVFSSALEYATPAAATASYDDPANIGTLERRIDGHLIPIPATAPGANHVAVVGKAAENGGTVPAYAIVWRHGRVINLILLFGPTKTVSRSHLVALAERQDTRVTAGGF